MLKGLRTVLAILNLARGIGEAAGTAREVGLRSGVFMLLVLMAGFAALFGPVLAFMVIGVVAGWILEGVNLDPRTLDGLVIVLGPLSFLIGMGAAASVLYGMTRPRSVLANATGLADDAEVLDEEGVGHEDPGGPEIDPAWLRAIDARLAVSQKTRAVGPRADRNRVLSSLGRTARRTTSRFRRLL